jgi:hypothetical protein
VTASGPRSVPRTRAVTEAISAPNDPRRPLAARIARSGGPSVVADGDHLGVADVLVERLELDLREAGRGKGTFRLLRDPGFDEYLIAPAPRLESTHDPTWIGNRTGGALAGSESEQHLAEDLGLRASAHRAGHDDRFSFTWDRGDGPAIWVLRLRDRALEQVTSGSPADAEPTWSPDGRRIAFMRRCDIFVQRLGALRATNLTRSRDVCEISPAWRPSS